MFLFLLFLLIMSQAAHAHPMGSKLFGHRMTVTVAPEQIKLSYVVEIPTSKLALMMDRFRRKRGYDNIGSEEQRAFDEDMKRYLSSNIHLSLNRESRSFKNDPNYAATQGLGDKRFFEYRIHLIVPIDVPEGQVVSFNVRNDNFTMQRAVYHNEIRARVGIKMINSDVPAHMAWMEGEQYRTVSARFREGAGDKTSGRDIDMPSLGVDGDTSLLGMLRTSELTMNVLIIALLTAIFLGAVHALSPGHGKALVAAYLVGSRGTVGHALWLAIIVTATHILSVVLMGVIALIAAQYIVPEYYLPFISLGSGLLIVGIGLWLVIRRARGRGVSAEHDHIHPRGDMSWRMLITFGVTGGIIPCPSAMVVMLTAIAIGRIGFGLALITFFSLGLALTLIAVGIIAIKASYIMDRFARTQALTRWLPLASAIVITALGFVIIYKGFIIEWMK